MGQITVEKYISIEKWGQTRAMQVEKECLPRFHHMNSHWFSNLEVLMQQMNRLLQWCESEMVVESMMEEESDDNDKLFYLILGHNLN